MAAKLVRQQQTGQFHFVTFSCHARRPHLGSPTARELFERSLETMRQRYKFLAAGYVVIPEHIQMLVSEPDIGRSGGWARSRSSRSERQRAERAASWKPMSRTRDMGHPHPWYGEVKAEVGHAPGFVACHRSSCARNTGI